MVKICALKQPNVTWKMTASSAKRSKFSLVKNKELVRETKEIFIEKLDDAKLDDLVNPPQENTFASQLTASETRDLKKMAVRAKALL